MFKSYCDQFLKKTVLYSARKSWFFVNFTFAIFLFREIIPGNKWMKLNLQNFLDFNVFFSLVGICNAQHTLLLNTVYKPENVWKKKFDNILKNSILLFLFGLFLRRWLNNRFFFQKIENVPFFSCRNNFDWEWDPKI